MRPEVLYDLFAGAEALKGIGANTLKRLETLCGVRIIDLLFHLPSGYQKRELIGEVSRVGQANSSLISLRVKILSHQKSERIPGKLNRLPHKVLCSDDAGGFLYLTFFNFKEAVLQSMLPKDQFRYISGKPERHGDVWEIVHPDYIAKTQQEIPTLEAVYPLTEGISNRQFRKFVAQAIERIPRLDECMDAALLKSKGWFSWEDSLRKIHVVGITPDDDKINIARDRLIYEELLGHQLAMAIIRNRETAKPAHIIDDSKGLANALVASLPFKLTEGQKSAISKIMSDLASGKRMFRLVQGDVGSGKTLVALYAMLAAVGSGFQSALMAPTEILARQHYTSVSRMLNPFGIKVAYLSGSQGRLEYSKNAAALSGEAQIVVGTHALFQQGVEFANLGLVVVDEQHRFGVEQRLKLQSKGKSPHILQMTATPIPRSLTMTVFGDMECSQILDKPMCRKPIETSVMPDDKMGDLYAGIRRAIARGERVFWVCPLVEESEVLDFTAVETRHAAMKREFGDIAGMVHGRMKAEAKEEEMRKFLDGTYKIMVATTVIEVGVNVPDATIMVIEHSEHFGLSQLHQLRGRVGRGDKPSYCILLYGNTISKTAVQRLKTMRRTDNGFEIAEEDLRIRGAGDLLGNRQSGLPAFRIADLSKHMDLLRIARDDAKLILNNDPKLNSPRGCALRNLLYIYECDKMVKLAGS